LLTSAVKPRKRFVHSCFTLDCGDIQAQLT
jgi:hypothetical protein